MPPALELADVVRSFGEVRALDGARLAVAGGEIHALLGENGAGKSTLVAIACGLLRPDSGKMWREGREVATRSTREALRLGLALVPQHDLLVEAATVADNLSRLDPEAPFLESRRARRDRVRRTAAALELDLGEPDAFVADLAVGTRQRIEIAGALLHDPAVLILDEPTAVLSPDETAALFSTLRKRAASGRSIVLITHRLSETFAYADRVTVLSRGRTVLQSAIADTTPEAIGAILVSGGELGSQRPPGARRAATELPGTSPALELEGFTTAGMPPLSLTVGEGELSTLLAIDGNGADALASAVAGVLPSRGSCRVAGRTVSAFDALSFRAAGGGYVPGDRRREGLFLDLSLRENLALRKRGGFLMDRAADAREAKELLGRHGVRASGPEARARELSGGNQQKLVLLRELSQSPRLLVAVHPTRGLDVGAAADVHQRLLEAQASGCGLLVVTADPEEARALGGTIRVVYRGRVSEPLAPSTPLAELGRRMGGLAA